MTTPYIDDVLKTDEMNLSLKTKQMFAKGEWLSAYRVYSWISIGYFWSRPPSGNFRGLHFGGFPGTYVHVDTGFEQISASRVWGNRQHVAFYQSRVGTFRASNVCDSQINENQCILWFATLRLGKPAEKFTRTRINDSPKEKENHCFSLIVTLVRTSHTFL